jgi:hypothetical protein
LRIAGTFFLIVNILAFVYFLRNRHRFFACRTLMSGFSIDWKIASCDNEIDETAYCSRRASDLRVILCFVF